MEETASTLSFYKAFIDAEIRILSTSFRNDCGDVLPCLDAFEWHSLYVDAIACLQAVQASLLMSARNARHFVDGFRQGNYCVKGVPSRFNEWIFNGFIEFLREMREGSNFIAANEDPSVAPSPIRMDQWLPPIMLLNDFLFGAGALQLLLCDESNSDPTLPKPFVTREQLAVDIGSLPALLISAMITTMKIERGQDFDMFVKSCDVLLPAPLHEPNYINALINLLLKRWQTFLNLSDEKVKDGFNCDVDPPEKTTLLACLTKRLAKKEHASGIATTLLVNLAIKDIDFKLLTPLAEKGSKFLVCSTMVPKLVVSIANSLLATSSEKDFVYSILKSLAPLFYLAATKSTAGITPNLRTTSEQDDLLAFDPDGLRLFVHSLEAFEVLYRVLSSAAVSVDWGFSIPYELFEMKSPYCLPVGLALAVIDILCDSIPKKLDIGTTDMLACRGTRFQSSRARTIAATFDRLIAQWEDPALQESLDKELTCVLTASLCRCISKCANADTTEEVYTSRLQGDKETSSYENDVAPPLIIDSKNLKGLLNGIHNRFGSPRRELLLCGMRVAECIGDHFLGVSLEQKNNSSTENDRLRFAPLHEPIKYVPPHLWWLLACDAQLEIQPRERIYLPTKPKTIKLLRFKDLSKRQEQSEESLTDDKTFLLFQECTPDSRAVSSSIKRFTEIIGSINTEGLFFEEECTYEDFAITTVTKHHASRPVLSGQEHIDPKDLSSDEEDKEYFSSLPDLVERIDTLPRMEGLRETDDSECTRKDADYDNDMQPPIHIRQCLERLVGPPNRAEIDKGRTEKLDPSRPLDKMEQPSQRRSRILETLIYLPSVLARADRELDSICAQLCRVLVLLEGEGIENFDQLQLQALTQLFTQRPILAMEHVCSTFYEPDWSVSNRLVMLRSMQLAARNLSGLSFELETDIENKANRKIPEKQASANALGTGPSKVSFGQAEQATSSGKPITSIEGNKTRIIASALKVPKAEINAFGNVASLFFDRLLALFYPLNFSSSYYASANARYKSYRKHECQQNCLADPVILGGMLHTLAVFIECGGVGSFALAHMVRCSLDLLQTYLTRNEAHVTRCLISLAGRCTLLRDWKLLSSLLDETVLDSVVLWLKSCTQSSDSISRKLGAVVLEDFSRIAQRN